MCSLFMCVVLRLYPKDTSLPCETKLDVNLPRPNALMYGAVHRSQSHTPLG